jgi:hypothetical protein
MPDDRGSEPSKGRHAGPPAVEEPGDPVPLGRHRRRRAAGTGAMAGTAAAVILLAAASPTAPARRGRAGSAGRDGVSRAVRREAEHV